MKRLTLPARTDRLNTLLDFINQELEQVNCPLKLQMQLCIAAEEIFVNIAHYAYDPAQGEATITMEIQDAPRSVTLTFEDAGKPYNPLSREDPDITLSADKREAGGLGIFMVKKSMDSVEYEHRDGKNILTLRKALNTD